MGLKDFLNRSSNQPSQAGPKSKFEKDGGILIKRNDGTFLDIAPVRDRNGNHKCMTAYSKVLQKNQTLYAYKMVDEMNIAPGRVSCNVYMPMDFNTLQNPTEGYVVANLLLRRDRLQKVIAEYHGYTGQKEYRADGSYGCAIDPSMIEVANILQKEESERLESQMSTQLYHTQQRAHETLGERDDRVR